MNQLQDKLLQLDEWYKNNDIELYQQLNPGLNSGDITKVENELSLFIAEDIKQLYQWHNGTNEEYIDIGLGAPFNSLTISLTERNTNIDAVGEDEWSPLWLPIFGEGDEQWFTVLSNRRLQTSPIYLYNFEDDNIYLHYENISSLINTILTGYETSILRPLSDRSDDYYEVYDSEQFESTRKKYNPNAYPFTKVKGQSVIPTFGKEYWPKRWHI